MLVFFVKAEDVIRDLVRLRGRGDGYKRRVLSSAPSTRGGVQSPATRANTVRPTATADRIFFRKGVEVMKAIARSKAR
mgnify:CR=1 FL=1